MTDGDRRGRLGGEQRKGVVGVATSIGVARLCRFGVTAE